jgi:recombination protein RecA
VSAAKKKTTEKKDEKEKKLAAVPAPKKVKAKDDATREEKLAVLKQNVNAMFKGRTLLQSGDEFVNVFILRRPTGITSLDIGIGGGMPAGGLTQVIGYDGAGKDYITNRTIANVQSTYGKNAAILLAMTELAFDKVYAKKCGVRIAFTKEEIDNWEKALGRKFTAEEKAWATDEIGAIHQVMATTAEELLEATAQCIESNLYQIVVINSFGALLTKAEEEADEGIAAGHYAGASRPITAFVKRLHAALNMPDSRGNPNLTTVIGINQVRENLGPDAKYRPVRTAGGRALKHGKLVDIMLEARGKIPLPGSDNRIIVGKEIHWEVLKGKAGCHDGPKGTYPFYFGENGYGFGADVFQDLIAIATLRGVVKLSGAWYSYDDGTTSIKGQGALQFSQALSQTPGAFDLIRQKVFDACGIAFITKEGAAWTQ